MRVFLYPLWRKQYFFHEDAFKHKELIGIYQPYRTLLKYIYSVWKNFAPIRYLFSQNINASIVEAELMDALPELKDATWVVDFGRKSLHRKVTGIIISNRNGTISKIFFKVGFTAYAHRAVKKEAEFYKLCEHLEITPVLYDCRITDRFMCYTSEYIEANKLDDPSLDETIIKLIKRISTLTITKATVFSNASHLKLSFAHGDMCPWNILKSKHDGKFRVIDWEFAGMYPIGFDLLTYIFQVKFLIDRKQDAKNIFEGNKAIIEKFYKDCGIDNWVAYLREYVNICEERQKGSYLETRFKELKQLLA